MVWLVVAGFSGVVPGSTSPIIPAGGRIFDRRPTTNFPAIPLVGADRIDSRNT